MWRVKMLWRHSTDVFHRVSRVPSYSPLDLDMSSRIKMSRVEMPLNVI